MHIFLLKIIVYFELFLKLGASKSAENEGAAKNVSNTVQELSAEKVLDSAINFSDDPYHPFGDEDILPLMRRRRKRTRAPPYNDGNIALQRGNFQRSNGNVNVQGQNRPPLPNYPASVHNMNPLIMNQGNAEQNKRQIIESKGAGLLLEKRPGLMRIIPGNVDPQHQTGAILYQPMQNNPYGQQNNLYQHQNGPYPQQNNPFRQQNSPYPLKNDAYHQQNNLHQHQNNLYQQQNEANQLKNSPYQLQSYPYQKRNNLHKLTQNVYYPVLPQGSLVVQNPNNKLELQVNTANLKVPNSNANFVERNVETMKKHPKEDDINNDLTNEAGIDKKQELSVDEIKEKFSELIRNSKYNHLAVNNKRLPQNSKFLRAQIQNPNIPPGGNIPPPNLNTDDLNQAQDLILDDQDPGSPNKAPENQKVVSPNFEPQDPNLTGLDQNPQRQDAVPSNENMTLPQDQNSLPPEENLQTENPSIDQVESSTAPNIDYSENPITSNINEDESLTMNLITPDTIQEINPTNSNTEQNVNPTTPNTNHEENPTNLNQEEYPTTLNTAQNENSTTLSTIQDDNPIPSDDGNQDETPVSNPNLPDENFTNAHTENEYITEIVTHQPDNQELDNPKQANEKDPSEIASKNENKTPQNQVATFKTTAALDLDYDAIPGWYEQDQALNLSLHTNHTYEYVPSVIGTILPYSTPWVSNAVEEAEEAMAKNEMGYFTAFIYQVLAIASRKPVEKSRELAMALKILFNDLILHKKVIHMGATAPKALIRVLGALMTYENIQAQAQALAVMLKNRNEILEADIINIFARIDSGYTDENGKYLLKVLKEIDEFDAPGASDALKIAHYIVEGVLRPYWNAPQENRVSLFQEINTAIEKRFIGLFINDTTRRENVKLDRKYINDNKEENYVKIKDLAFHTLDNDKKMSVEIDQLDDVETENIKSDENQVSDYTFGDKNSRMANYISIRKGANRIETKHKYRENEFSKIKKLKYGTDQKNIDYKNTSFNLTQSNKNQDTKQRNFMEHNKIDKHYLMVPDNTIIQHDRTISKGKQNFISRLKSNKSNETKYVLNTKGNSYDRLKQHEYNYENFLRNKYNNRKNVNTQTNKKAKDKSYQDASKNQKHTPKLKILQKEHSDSENDDDSYDKEILSNKIRIKGTKKPEYPATNAKKKNNKNLEFDKENVFSKNRIKIASDDKNIVKELNNIDKEFKVKLFDAIRHSGYMLRNYRKTDNTVKVRKKINELSSYSDEEGLLKRNIYKAFGDNSIF